MTEPVIAHPRSQDGRDELARRPWRKPMRRVGVLCVFVLVVVGSATLAVLLGDALAAALRLLACPR